MANRKTSFSKPAKPAPAIIEATADALVQLGHPAHTAVLGPCIRPRCYEFHGSERHELATRYGATVLAETAGGAPAIDLAAAVAAASAALGLAFGDGGTCTACSPVHWSHRARGDLGRQALVAWVEP